HLFRHIQVWQRSILDWRDNLRYAGEPVFAVIGSIQPVEEFNRFFNNFRVFVNAQSLVSTGNNRRLLRFITYRITCDSKVDVRIDFLDGLFIPRAFTCHERCLAGSKVADLGVAVTLKRLICSMLDRCVDELKEVIGQNRMFSKCRVARDEAVNQILRAHTSILSCRIHELLEDAVPLSPPFICVGLRSDAVRFLLGDRLMQFSRSRRELRSTSLLKQIFVVEQREKGAFNRKTQYAVGG